MPVYIGTPGGENPRPGIEVGQNSAEPPIYFCFENSVRSGRTLPALPIKAKTVGDVMKKGGCPMMLFARYPEPGKAKTRLIPALGPAGAAALHREGLSTDLRHYRKLFRDFSCCLPLTRTHGPVTASISP